MHPNGLVLERLFTALQRHDHLTMASCYDPKAKFSDIAFCLPNKDCTIQDMWHMICKCSDITVTFEIIEANDLTGRVKVTDDYTYNDTGLGVHNVIDSRFLFQNGKIIKHEDECDPRAWANMAFDPGFRRFLARIGLVRRWTAKKKLKKFVRSHYQCEEKRRLRTSKGGRDGLAPASVHKGDNIQA